VELSAAALVLSDVVDSLSVLALGVAGGARLIVELAEELTEACRVGVERGVAAPRQVCRDQHSCYSCYMLRLHHVFPYNAENSWPITANRQLIPTELPSKRRSR